MTQAEALEIAMKLEASPIRNNHVGVEKIEIQLGNLTLELQDLKKDKETKLEVWCKKCKEEGHYKDEFPVFKDYLASGVHNQLNPGLWCNICRERGQHHSDDCYLLQKYVQTLKQIFCNFCRSIGHDEKNFQSYYLMMEHIVDSYRLQA